MTMWIDYETAVRQLNDERLGLLLHCHDVAMKKYNQVFRPELPLCDPRSMPTILHEMVLQEARWSFADRTGVMIRDPAIGGRFLLEIDRALTIQFKKLTHDFQTANNPTETSRRFDQQELGDGLPPFPRLTAGYQLDQYNTAMSGVYLAFIVGDDCQWYHDLRTGEHNLTLEFPSPSGPSPAELEMERERWERMNHQAHQEGS